MWYTGWVGGCPSHIPANWLGKGKCMLITKRFLPYAGVTYNFHTMKDLVWRSNEGGYHFSHFPGIEIGFKISPKRENGWQIEYKNTFLGELVIYGIYDLSTNPGNGFLEDIVNRTIGNGFLGRLDVGKSIINTPTQRMNAGFVVLRLYSLCTYF